MAAFTGTVAGRAQTGPYESPAKPAPEGEIDHLVFGKLEQLNIEPANLCSDAVFVRRVYLDVIGTLPTAREASSFILNRDPNKRGKLIDQLLARDEFADYWAMKWSDLLRVKAEFPINLWPNAAQAYHRWIRTAIRENVPYDQFVRELLTASGSNFQVGQVNFYRAMQNRDPQGIAQTVALTFMGERAEKWPRKNWPAWRCFSRRSATNPRRSGRRKSSSSIPPRPTRNDRGNVSRRHHGQAFARPGSARGVRRLADGREESLVRAQHREPRLVLAAGPRHHSGAGRHPARQSAQQSRTAGVSGKGIGRVALRFETSLPADFELADLPVVLHSPKPPTGGGRGQFCLLPAAPAGRGSAGGRLVPDHRHDGKILQRDSGAVHVHSGNRAFDRAAGRQHHQFLPGNVRPAAARHRPGIGAQQPPHRRPEAAPAELEPHPAQDRAER